MIKLYSFGAAYGLVDASPFVTKVNLFMTIHGIPFEPVYDVMNLGKAPKQKFPYIEDNGKIIADSSFIIEHLSKKHQIDMDAWLSAEQRASAYLIGKSLEENLYWCIVHSRWIAKDTWPIVKENFFGSMPFPLSVIVPIVAQRKVRNNLKGHGIGRHSDAEIMAIAKHSLQSLSTLLGNKPYFFGEKISSLDICTYAMIANLTHSTIDNDMSRMGKTFENLVAFAQRIKSKYYPQLD